MTLRKLFLSFIFAAVVSSCTTVKVPLEPDDNKRPFLGVEFKNKLQELKMPIADCYSALAVHLVYPNTPADRAGLKNDDLILKINNQKLKQLNIFSSQDFTTYVKKQKIGEKLNLTVYRQNLKASYSVNGDSAKDLDSSEVLYWKNKIDSKKEVNEISAKWESKAEIKDVSISLEGRTYSYGSLDVRPLKNFSVSEFSLEKMSNELDLKLDQKIIDDTKSLVMRFQNLNKKSDMARPEIVSFLQKNPLNTLAVADEIKVKLKKIGENPVVDAAELLSQITSVSDKLIQNERYKLNGSYLDHLIYGVKRSQNELLRSFDNLSINQFEDLKRNLPNMRQHFTEEIYLQNSLEEPQFGFNVNLLKMISKIQPSYFVIANKVLAKSLNQKFLAKLKTECESRLKKEEKNELYLKTSIGEVLISGTQNDRHLEDHSRKLALIVDLGGDDYYGDSTSRIIDYSGNDSYENSTDWNLGAATFDVNFLVDLDGQDRYIARQGSFGASQFGVSIFWDANGEDEYRCQVYCLGSAFGGIAIAIDEKGIDRYESLQLSQGVGIAGAIGFLADLAGNDTYYSKGLNPSSYGDKGQFEGWSQGVGVGLRGFVSGGIGILYDRSGQDKYEAGNFSQGGGYYFGLGMLVDQGSENDKYLGSRYAQGFSAHYAAGIFSDAGGDDDYDSRDDVAEGIAWDLGISLFEDRGGNDRYKTGGHCLGAASQSSFSFFIDHDGQDTYVGKLLPFTQEKTPNDYHSGTNFGLFLDLGGKVDSYESFKNDSSFVRESYQVLFDK